MCDQERFGRCSLLDDPLEQLAGRATGWRKDDYLEAKCKRKARAKDGDAAKRIGAS